MLHSITLRLSCLVSKLHATVRNCSVAPYSGSSGYIPVARQQIVVIKLISKFIATIYWLSSLLLCWMGCKIKSEEYPTGSYISALQNNLINPYTSISARADQNNNEKAAQSMGVGENQQPNHWCTVFLLPVTGQLTQNSALSLGHSAVSVRHHCDRGSLKWTRRKKTTLRLS